MTVDTSNRVTVSDTMHPFEQHVFIAYIIYDLRRGADDTIGHAALATPAQDMFYRRMLQSIDTWEYPNRTTWEQVALDIAVSDYRATCGDDAPSWYDTMLELLISFYGNTYEMEHQLPRTAYSRMCVQITIRAAVAWLAKNHVLHHVLDGAYALHQRLYPGQSVATDQGYRIIFRAMVLSCLDRAVQSAVDADVPLTWQEPLVAVRMVERISSPDVLDSMEQTVRDYYGM